MSNQGRRLTVEPRACVMCGSIDKVDQGEGRGGDWGVSQQSANRFFSLEIRYFLCLLSTAGEQKDGRFTLSSKIENQPDLSFSSKFYENGAIVYAHIYLQNCVD